MGLLSLLQWSNKISLAIHIAVIYRASKFQFKSNITKFKPAIHRKPLHTRMRRMNFTYNVITQTFQKCLRYSQAQTVKDSVKQALTYL